MSDNQGHKERRLQALEDLFALEKELSIVDYDTPLTGVEEDPED